MGEYRVSIESDPRPADVQILADHLSEHNMMQTGRADGQELAIFVRDETDQIVAGIYGWTWAGWLEIKYLWVQQGLRGPGYGLTLLLSAEREAVA